MGNIDDRIKEKLQQDRIANRAPTVFQEDVRTINGLYRALNIEIDNARSTEFILVPIIHRLIELTAFLLDKVQDIDELKETVDNLEGRLAELEKKQ